MKKEYLKEDLYKLAEIEKEYGDDLKIETIDGVNFSKDMQAEVLLGFGVNSILPDGYYIAINLDTNRDINSSNNKIFSGPYSLEDSKIQFREWCDNIMGIEFG